MSVQQRYRMNGFQKEALNLWMAFQEKSSIDIFSDFLNSQTEKFGNVQMHQKSNWASKIKSSYNS